MATSTNPTPHPQTLKRQTYHCAWNPGNTVRPIIAQMEPAGLMPSLQIFGLKHHICRPEESWPKNSAHSWRTPNWRKKCQWPWPQKLQRRQREKKKRKTPRHKLSVWEASGQSLRVSDAIRAERNLKIFSPFLPSLSSYTCENSGPTTRALGREPESHCTRY